MWKTMNSDNGFLSQDEIDSLLNDDENSDAQENTSESIEENTQVLENTENVENIEESSEDKITDIEMDLLGEIGNISMGSASTALSTIIGSAVNITTPQVRVTTLKELRDTFEVPNIALEVKYTSGIIGGNLLVMKIPDAAVIANLMMGGDGRIEEKSELTEIEESAVSEAMNQMIGSAATSMATMFSREVNISPPVSKIWKDNSMPLCETIKEDEDIIEVSFKLTIGDLVDSNIMQILPIKTAKKIVSIMMGQEEKGEAVEQSSNQTQEPNQTQNQEISPSPKVEPKPVETYSQPQYTTAPQMQYTAPQPQVNIQKASFAPLQEANINGAPQNIDLILDVPLEISVVLGKTKKSIKDVLALGTGSLIELDKLAEEPVEIYVNGKKIAYGEVVVVDENFGVRIVNIVSGEERVKSLKG
ncbi:flagellar motor switch protein [Clostridium botulinum]|uniref:Flagellar motor switch protein n=2 Tax=Clostridium botulinum TaxID=1491 RepID=A0A9Q1ZCQ1_CLOBO|nr:flagellar motor switch protein FliN [Clostridium botulinum BKT015925]KEH98564.1 flagellar motor switch protein [Clostridium botulinum D str. 16868]KEI05772.1 flagellar motor switch protein [Clostridium botulinum C/D str. Sp77]KLU75610.1 flagellar motor switch protein [Clostridium botulinum V891]KOA75317.1 flagellar motor switch protein [Clostridium botulinum]MCD3196688.1 flagellar motor switch phosphatase FliY [Clostridium botulinum C/D]